MLVSLASQLVVVVDGVEGALDRGSDNLPVRGDTAPRSFSSLIVHCVFALTTKPAAVTAAPTARRPVALVLLLLVFAEEDAVPDENDAKATSPELIVVEAASDKG